MAGHPLRPATRRRLGRPSPHQQADRPRAHPTPQKLSPTSHATSKVYSVLDPVSQAYPKVQGRSPTCYSPVRHSSTPERAFPFDLHVLSTPPAFVLSQDQTLQTKPLKGQSEKHLTKATSNKLASKIHTPKREKEAWQKQQQTKITKHTIEFSNNTPARPRKPPRGFWPLVGSADGQEPTEVVLPSGTPSRSAVIRVATTSQQVT